MVVVSPPVIGNIAVVPLKVAGAIGAMLNPKPVKAETVALSSATEVVPPVTAAARPICEMQSRATAERVIAFTLNLNRVIEFPSPWKLQGTYVPDSSDSRH